jgi:hypothetical protein
VQEGLFFNYISNKIGRSFGGVYSLMLELSQAFLMPLLMRNKYWVLVV